jgi:uncharacterized membrane protein HdeD (DUF308 family)
METKEIAQWIVGLFVFLAGILAIGKLLSERDDRRGYCNIYLKASKKTKKTKTNTEKLL